MAICASAALELAALAEVLARLVPERLPLLDLLSRHAEQEEVLLADQLADLDVGAVERADGQRAVERELHVAGAGRLLAGQRDLLREVGGGVDALPERDVEVRQEHDLQTAGDVGIVVDDGRDVVDELDDELRHPVARRGLGPEDDGPRDDAGRRIGLDSVVERDDVQQLQMLALVLVQALDHHVEQGGRVDRDAGPILEW